MEQKDKKEIIKENYSKIAQTGTSCNCGCGMSNTDISKDIGYSDEEISNVPEANLGLGCGNPTALAELEKGEVVLDLGSGAGFDVFLASKKVGETGKVFGVDMSNEMIKKAETNAKKNDYKNVEFKLGDIEDLPIENNSIDTIISNCVINLSLDKEKVFRESNRVLKDSGKMFISDMVLVGELTEEQKKDENLLTACVSGAIQKEDYLNKLKKSGFEVTILNEDKGISERQYQKLPVESLKLKAVKTTSLPEELCCADKNICSINCSPNVKKEDKSKEDSETKCGCGGCC